MRLTKDKLRSLISEVVANKNKNSMILSEIVEDNPDDQASLPTSPVFQRIITILEGQDASVQTIIIMTGQNPMAKKTDNQSNLALAKQLEMDITKMGLQYIPVGGRFGGNEEDSVMILNPTREQGRELNEKYSQWGYVWGQDMPNFQMIQIDYEGNQGEFVAPGSKTATTIDSGPSAQSATDNYSYDYASSRKFVISLY